MDYPLEIDNPLATCGHCNFATTLTGKWSVEDGRLVFRAALNPLTRRGPDLASCCESNPIVEFRQILVNGEPLSDEQATTLRASAPSSCSQPAYNGE